MSHLFAVMMCGLLLVACSSGTPSRQSEPTEANGVPGDAAEPGPTSTDPESAGEGASFAEYSGRKCFGYRPTILGTPGDDLIRASHADDVIITLGGNDIVVGPRGAKWGDRICTGPGDDSVDYHRHRGRDGLDHRVGLGRGNDLMTVKGPFGGRVGAGAGNDTILFARGSWPDVAPGPGDDLVRAPDAHGEFRTICIDLTRAPGPVRIDLARGRATGQGHDRFHNARCAFGGRFNDVLFGTPRKDWLDGGGGLDLVRAGAGDDKATGGYSTFSATGSNYWIDRADKVYLGPGDDEAEGDLGRDRLYGGPGSDMVTGGPDGDYLDGGRGDDYLYSGSSCLDGTEDNPFTLEEMLTDDYRRDAEGRLVRVPSAGNEVFGRSGNDFLSGDRGNDRLDGGLGFDSGTGGYYDGRIDWIESVERPDYCESRPFL